MDSKYIESEHIVERYLSGELTVREAREFEKYCREHPAALKQMAIPLQLKARLAKGPPQSSETGIFKAIPSDTSHAAVELGDEGFDEEDVAQWGSREKIDARARWLIIGLAIVLAGAIGGAVVFGLEARALDEKLQRVQREQKTAAMQAPAGVQRHQVQLARNKPQQATLAPGWLQPPQLLDLHIDPGAGKYNAYQITLDKVDGTRVMQIRRITRDSNREVRVALNSSAFGPGDYLMKVEGYTWRGQLEEVGWVRLGLE